MKGLKAKGVYAPPGDYAYFKSQVPLHKIPVGKKQWRYYEFGPKVLPPLICIPGIAGTADVHYKQIMALSMKGYRVISIDIPHVWKHREWLYAFEKFLDAIDVHHIHIYGTSLGGFLAQLFAQHRPRRVKSLVLSNTFLDTHSFSEAMRWAPILSWTPSFLLKRYVLMGIPAGPHEPFIADSVDFVVSQVETLTREDLASRLSLTADATSVGPLLLLSDSSITIMDTNDYCSIPQQLKDEVVERYPGARQAHLKTGRDFPFLSRPDEVNLHLQLHLRRVGVEPLPDLVPGAPKTADVQSPHEENGRTVNHHFPNSDEGSSGGPLNSEERDDGKEIVEGTPTDEEHKTENIDEEHENENDMPEAEKDSCTGSVGFTRKDTDDPAEDDKGGSGGPSKGNGVGNAEDPPKDADGNSKDPPENCEKQAAPSNTDESVASPALEDLEFSDSNKEIPGYATKHPSGILHDAYLLNQERQHLCISCNIYNVPEYPGSRWRRGCGMKLLHCDA